jgi:sulfur-oxidizing protein SoxY
MVLTGDAPRTGELMLAKRLLFASLTLLATATLSNAEDDPWRDIRPAVFSSREILEGDGAVAIYGPEQAEDAALVPISMRLPNQVANSARALTLIVDRNPAPVAATFRFGDAYRAGSDIGERKLETRIRVDSFSNVRAILETADGKLHMAKIFVRGAGGCSAPASKDADEALANLGKMQVKSLANQTFGPNWRDGLVMIRHPNFTGMQMDPDTRGYTPARFVDKLEVRRGSDPSATGTDDLILSMEGGISISENPSLRFNYDAAGDEALFVRASDTQGTSFSGRSQPSGS